MRILLVTICPTAETGGGMARLVHELAEALAVRHTVLLLRPGKDSSVIPPGIGAPGYLQLCSLGQGDAVIPLLNGASRRWLNQALAEFAPELVHAQDFSPLALYMQDWARARGIPFLLTLHLMPSNIMFGSTEGRPARLQRFISRTLFRIFLRRVLLRCFALTALNRAQESELHAADPNRPIHLVPNGLALGELNALPFAETGEVERLLLFVGSFARRKNQAYLLEVLRLLPANVYLSLLGETLEPGYLESLRAQMLRDGLSGRVTLGHCPHAEIPARLQAAHLFVSASTLEVQSLAVLEALASGTPVVGLSNQTIDELVDDTVGARLPADAPPAVFARRVSELLALAPDNYTALCARARECVHDHGWPAVIERLSAVYREVASQPAGKRLRPVWTPWLCAGSGIIWGWHAVRRKLARTPRKTR